MRLLVACPQCNRQYDASRLSIGQRFRCHCGSVLTVQQPRGHDAAVVCCSHCGAPRSEGSLKCEYCGADFTLHERDLDTVCPHCLTRVSNHARFCHFCGKPIHPEMVAGIKSTLVCPECGEGHMLVSRAWGDVSALECGRCAGLWLSDVSFQRLTDQAAEEGMHIESRDRMPQARLPETDVPAFRGRSAISPLRRVRTIDGPPALRPAKRRDHRRVQISWRVVRCRRTAANPRLDSLRRPGPSQRRRSGQAKAGASGRSEQAPAGHAS